MVGQVIRNNKQVLNAPLLLRLTEAECGTADEVVYAPVHLQSLSCEIQEVLKFLAPRSNDDILGENMTGRATVAGLRAYLAQLASVAEQGISEREGLFAFTD